MMRQLLCQMLFGNCLAAGFIALSWLFRQRGAATRHALLFAATVSIAIPFQLLVEFGEQLRRVLPTSAFPVFSIPAPSLMSAISLSRHPEPRSGDWGTWLPFFLGLWLFVAAFLLLRWLRRLLQSPPLGEKPSAEDLELLKAAEKLMGFHRMVSLIVSGGSSEPCLSGLFRSVLILPKSMGAVLSLNERTGIVLHELAHAKRRDNLSLACAQVIACIFWFNPLVWWLVRSVKLQAEVACDELVLQAGIEPDVYISGIVMICQHYLLEPLAGRSNISSPNLKNRLEHIMTLPTFARRSNAALLCGCLLLIAASAATTTVGFAATSKDSGHANDHGATCQVAGQSFPEGSVIRLQGQSAVQRCAMAAGTPKWVRTDANHIGSAKVITVREASPRPVTSCRETAPQDKFCTCDDRRFSPGAVVGSARGSLVCPASGGRWQPYSGSVKPWPPAPLSR